MLYTILIIIFTLAIGYETYKGAHYQRSYAKMMTFERQRDMEAKLYYMAANPVLYLDLIVSIVLIVMLVVTLFTPAAIPALIILLLWLLNVKQYHEMLYLLDCAISNLMYALIIFRLLPLA